MDEKAVNVKRIPADLWQRLKVQAALEGKTLQDLVTAAIQQYLDRAA